jgi:hypothetical protein
LRRACLFPGGLKVITQKLLKAVSKATLGPGMTASILAENGSVTIEKYKQYRSRIKMINRALRDSVAHLDCAYQSCLQHVRPVTCPLALISQIQRSGGSMLSQLFDGHPELHAHPHELKIGYPKKYIWPHIDLNATPEEWFRILFEDIAVRHFRYGYKKMEKYEETFLFIFLLSLQKEIFFDYLDSLEAIDIRDVFNAYMTSYFGAWVNNQNILGQKKFVTAFTPRLATLKENINSFFKIYPDGLLISVIRDPRNWLPSATRHLPDKYGDVKQALNQWNESAQGMLWNKERYGDRVCIINFEDLIRRTKAVMQYLAGFLKIGFDDIFLIPTFNKIPIKPNTSFGLEDPGIMASALSRYKTLEKDELRIVDEMSGGVYEKVLGVVASIP